jgi:DNA-directed RNA polymerase subunit RPC12/RpoP
VPLKTCTDCLKEFQTTRSRYVRCYACGTARYRAFNPARAQVTSAIRAGRLVRQPCEVCGAVKVDAHHDDYSRPLDVRWLCRAHHRQHHIAEDRALLAAQAGA